MTEPHSGRRRGILFVMTGASGVGKGTLRAAAADALADVDFSISATTRPRREGEVDGVHYRFLDRDVFERGVADGAMLEHAEYVGDLYGTPAGPVDAALVATRFNPDLKRKYQALIKKTVGADPDNYDCSCLTHCFICRN